MELAQRYLAPLRRGLEIGASAINPFDGLRCWNLEHPEAAVWAAAQEALADGRAPIHVHGTADRLPIRDGQLDYLLSSHVIEHLPDTIGTLLEWDRVVRDDGLVFVIAPHRERTFDRHRARTPVEHHLADHALAMDEARDALAPTSHYHVWTTADFVGLLEHLVAEGALDWELLEVEDVDSKVGNGFTVVARKRSRRAPAAAAPGAVAFRFATLLLPFQVPGEAADALPGGSLEHVLGPDDDPAEVLPCRGPWRLVPVHAGHPPVAGAPSRVLVGAPAARPRLERLELDGSTLVLHGQGLLPGSWVEATLPDGSCFRALPRHDAGRLRLDLGGLVIPPGDLPIRVVTPEPGGGASDPLPLRERPAAP